MSKSDLPTCSPQPPQQPAYHPPQMYYPQQEATPIPTYYLPPPPYSYHAPSPFYQMPPPTGSNSIGFSISQMPPIVSPSAPQLPNFYSPYDHSQGIGPNLDSRNNTAEENGHSDLPAGVILPSSVGVAQPSSVGVNQPWSVGVNQPSSVGVNLPSSGNSLYPQLPTTTELDKPTPLPPKLVLLWEGSKAAKLYFVQKEGHVVSPSNDLKLNVYKCPPMENVSAFPPGSLSGCAKDASVLLTMETAWRLGLCKSRSFLVQGLHEEIAFYDESTNPERYVIIILPKEVRREERQRLFVLLRASSSLEEEPTNVVEKFESGVESVFDSVTKSIDSLVKKETPSVHSSTKWLRKGTGNIVRFGGGIISKGVHLVSDNVLEKDAPKSMRQQHFDLVEALKKTRAAIESKTVSYIAPL